MTEILSEQDRKEILPNYNYVVVTPGFEANSHHSGLFWDTRIRLLAASMYFHSGKAENIIVGGAKVRKMSKSFAGLMQEVLIKKYDIPESVIITEESSFDTSSQIKWLGENFDKFDGSIALIADSEQAYHVKALLKGHNLDQVDILSAERIIESLSPDSKYAGFVEKLHKSIYWKRWTIREELLSVFTETVDCRGEKLGSITRSRLRKK